jgi:hypothetical protein
MSILKKLLLAAVIAAASTSASAAISVSASAGLTSSEGGATTLTFDNGLLPNGFATYDNNPGALIPYPGNSGYAALPPADSSAYFFSVGATHGQPSSSSVTFGGNGVSYFGYYMGSPDNYNIVTLYHGNTELGTYTGNDMAAAASQMANGNQGVGFFVNYKASGGDTITKVTFSSNTDAFETDNHAYIAAVPEPETYAMLLGGLSMLAFLVRRKKA